MSSSKNSYFSTNAVKNSSAKSLPRTESNCGTEIASIFGLKINTEAAPTAPPIMDHKYKYRKLKAELSLAKAQVVELKDECEQKDTEIEHLRALVARLQTDLNYIQTQQQQPQTELPPPLQHSMAAIPPIVEFIPAASVPTHTVPMGNSNIESNPDSRSFEVTGMKQFPLMELQCASNSSDNVCMTGMGLELTEDMMSTQFPYLPGDMSPSLPFSPAKGLVRPAAHGSNDVITPKNSFIRPRLMSSVSAPSPMQSSLSDHGLGRMVGPHTVGIERSSSVSGAVLNISSFDDTDSDLELMAYDEFIDHSENPGIEHEEHYTSTQPSNDTERIKKARERLHSEQELEAPAPPSSPSYEHPSDEEVLCEKEWSENKEIDLPFEKKDKKPEVQQMKLQAFQSSENEEARMYLDNSIDEIGLVHQEYTENDEKNQSVPRCEVVHTVIPANESTFDTETKQTQHNRFPVKRNLDVPDADVSEGRGSVLCSANSGENEDRTGGVYSEEDGQNSTGEGENGDGDTVIGEFYGDRDFPTFESVIAEAQQIVAETNQQVEILSKELHQERHEAQLLRKSMEAKELQVADLQAEMKDKDVRIIQLEKLLALKDKKPSFRNGFLNGANFSDEDSI